MAADVTVTFRPNPRWDVPDTPELRRFMDRVGTESVKAAQRLCPVDEGDLISTIRYRRDGLKVTIAAGNMAGRTKFVDYARYVERGTSRAAAQPFLRPGVTRAVRVLT